MNNTIRINTNRLYEYIQETNDMIEHLLYINKKLEQKLNNINKIIYENIYIDLVEKTQFIDEIGIELLKKEVSYGTNDI